MYPPSLNCGLARALHHAFEERVQRGEDKGEEYDVSDVTEGAKLGSFLTRFDQYGGGLQGTTLQHSDFFTSAKQKT